jgi:hypothetical protein
MSLRYTYLIAAMGKIDLASWNGSQTHSRYLLFSWISTKIIIHKSEYNR